MTQAALQPLKAPFPYFGGKSKVAQLVWSRFGNVRNFIEPFCGTTAMLLLRPHEPKVETINDLDCYVANFWRAVKMAREQVVEHCDWPVIEADLHARHKYLVLSDDAVEFRRRMRSDPEYFDPKIAGWWVWGQCMWIGAGWCTNNSAVATPNTEARPHLGSDGQGQGLHRPIKQEIPASHGKGVHARSIPSEQLPNLSGESGAVGRGILTSKRPKLSGNGGGSGIHAEGLRDGSRIQLADQFARGRGVHANDSASTCESRRAWLMGWFSRLEDRLRSVRVCCGDFERVCNSPSVTTRIASGKDQYVGVFLDPEYAHEVESTDESDRDLFGKSTKSNFNRDPRLYGHDSAGTSKRVNDWCLRWGPDPKMRIAVCGYEGEHDNLEKLGWSVSAWTANGGYGNRDVNGNLNKTRERIWFSPACLKPSTSAGDLGGTTNA